jgi:hypothetical protein
MGVVVRGCWRKQMPPCVRQKGYTASLIVIFDIAIRLGRDSDREDRCGSCVGF